MKRQIRKGVFESNSSSVHSITYSFEGRQENKLPINKDGYIEVDFGHFGKEYEIYDSQYDKLSYLMTCLAYISSMNINNVIYEHDEFKNIEEAICNYTGAKGIKILGSVDPELDHQSIPYDGIEIINTYDEEEVVNFVFNKNIWLKTSCD